MRKQLVMLVALLGHTDIRVTERYIVTDVEALRNALEQSKSHKK